MHHFWRKIDPAYINTEFFQCFMIHHCCVLNVPNSTSTEKFEWKSLLKIDEKTRCELHRSAAGGYIASWVLGIRDRHCDNMMMKDARVTQSTSLPHTLP